MDSHITTSSLNTTYEKAFFAIYTTVSQLFIYRCGKVTKGNQQKKKEKDGDLCRQVVNVFGSCYLPSNPINDNG